MNELITKVSDNHTVQMDGLLPVSNLFNFQVQSVDFGINIFISEKNNKASANTYIYSDDNTSVYFACLFVSTQNRKQKLGSELLKVHEQIGFNLKAKYSFLCVEKKSWVKEWYERNEYSFFKNHENKKFIWMRKLLCSNGC